VQPKLSKLFRYSFILFVLLGVFGYGLVVAIYKVFPYSQIYALKQLVKPNPHADGRNGEHRVELFEKFPASADVVFIGDSITQGGEWSDFFPNLKTSNRGVSSDKTSDVLRRMDSIFAVAPQVAFIMLGINDIYNQVPTDEIVANYRSIISLLRDKNVSVVVQSTIQCQLTKCGQGKASQVNLLNDKLKSLTEELNVPYVLLTELSSQQGLDADYTYDGVHLTAIGYKRWVENIEAVLQSR